MTNGAIILKPYPIGTYSMGGIALPAGYIQQSVAFDRTAWSADAVVECIEETSVDGGVTWTRGGGFLALGGITIDPSTGLPATQSDVTNWFPESLSQQRAFRATMIVHAGSVSTAASFSAVAVASPPPIPTHNSIAYTGQTDHKEGGAVALIATTVGINSTTGNGIGIGGIWVVGSAIFTSFTDTSGNSYTTGSGSDSGLGTVVDGATGVIAGCRAAQNSNITGASGQKFTLTCNANCFPCVFVMEVSGQLTTGMLDKTGSLSSSATTTHTYTSTGALSQNNELAFLIGGQRSVATNAPTIGGGFTGLVAVATGEVGGYKNVTDGSAQTGSFTTNVNVSCAGIVMTFKEAAAATTRVPILSLTGAGL